MTFYGAVLRDTICASEVYNECFYTSDRRISVFKIAEILANELSKEGWIKERKKNTIYGDQRNTFIRIFCDDEPVNEPVQDVEVENAAQEQTDSAENVTVTNDNLQSQAETLDAAQPSDDNNVDSDVADDEPVTVISSQNFDCDDEEEFLTDEDFEELHQITRDLRCWLRVTLLDFWIIDTSSSS